MATAGSPPDTVVESLLDAVDSLKQEVQELRAALEADRLPVRPLLTFADLCRVTGHSAASMYQAIDEGLIAPVRIRAGSLRFTPESVERMIREAMRPARTKRGRRV